MDAVDAAAQVSRRGFLMLVPWCRCGLWLLEQAGMHQ